MKVSFTGTQQGMTEFQKIELKQRLIDLNVTEFIHGDCIGADSEANAIAIESGIKVFHLFPSNLGAKRAICFPTNIQTDGHYYAMPNSDILVKMELEENPLFRNKKIVDASDQLIACPKEHQHTLRSGTWATIRYAWKKKKNVLVIPPIVRED